MRPSRFTAVAAGVFALATLRAAAEAPEGLPKGLDREKLDVITDPRKLPEDVQKAWAAKLGQTSLNVAPARAPFQATDDIGDPSLPGRRLINAGVSARHAVVHFETGGVAHTRTVYVFTRDSGTATLAWSGSLSRGYEDAEEFLAAIQSGDLFAHRSTR